MEAEFERAKTFKQWRFSVWRKRRRRRRRRRMGSRRRKRKTRRRRKRRRRCELNLLSKLWAGYWQFLLLPPVNYKCRCFLNTSSYFVHVPINVLTDCVPVMVFLNVINQLGSKIGMQRVYCKVRTTFLNTQFNFRFQKGQLNTYRGIIWTFVYKCS